MENNRDNLQNGASQPSKGTKVPEGQSKRNENEVREGDSTKQRPEHGADGGTNTASREDQLPSLNDGGSPATDDGSNVSSAEEQTKGSDADKDHGGKASV